MKKKQLKTKIKLLENYIHDLEQLSVYVHMVNPALIDNLKNSKGKLNDFIS
jgi:hypothetical protein